MLQAKYVQPAKYVHLAKYLQYYAKCVFTEKVDTQHGSVDTWGTPARYIRQWVRLYHVVYILGGRIYLAYYSATDFPGFHFQNGHPEILLAIEIKFLGFYFKTVIKNTVLIFWFKNIWFRFLPKFSLW